MNETALIVEDDEDLANIFAEALHSVGFEVEHVADGKKAEERLEGGTPPYLILLDMHIPHISGGDLLTEIRNDERFSSTNVILTTADARMAEAFEELADFVMVKPISFVQLRDLTARLRK